LVIKSHGIIKALIVTQAQSDIHVEYFCDCMDAGGRATQGAVAED